MANTTQGAGAVASAPTRVNKRNTLIEGEGKTISLTVPESLYNELMQIARQNHRYINQEVWLACENHVKQYSQSGVQTPNFGGGGQGFQGSPDSGMPNF